MDSITALRDLVGAGFVGTRQFGTSGELTTLVYCRWWTGDRTDALVVRAEHDSDVLRVVGFNPLRPHDLAHARVLLRDRGEVAHMVAAVLDLPVPHPGVPLTLRTARAGRSAEQIAALGNL